MPTSSTTARTTITNAYRKAARELNQTILQADPKKPVVYSDGWCWWTSRRLQRTEKETRIWLEAGSAKAVRCEGLSSDQWLQTKRADPENRLSSGRFTRKQSRHWLTNLFDFANGIEGRKAGASSGDGQTQDQRADRFGATKGEGVQNQGAGEKAGREPWFYRAIDRGGKRWKIDNYAEMLVRTHMIKANNAGFVNRLLENGVEPWKCPTTPSACPICQPHEGQGLQLDWQRQKKYGKAPAFQFTQIGAQFLHLHWLKPLNLQ